MTKSACRGFTLIELMIVVAIIAIIAAIAIPSLLRSRVAANEVSCQATLKELVSAEAVWRQTDADRNGAQDYWTLDVAGFYAMTDASGAPLKGVDLEVAKSDWTGWWMYPIIGGQGDKSGYRFNAYMTDQDGGGYQLDADGDGVANTNPSRFGFGGSPLTYGTTGVRCYIVNEEGVVYMKDLGSTGAFVIWPGADPVTMAAWSVAE